MGWRVCSSGECDVPCCDVLITQESLILFDLRSRCPSLLLSVGFEGLGLAGWRFGGGLIGRSGLGSEVEVGIGRVMLESFGF